MTDYTPIPCALYDRYEVAILHHATLRISWRDAAGTIHLETLQPLDLLTRAGAEFLIARRLTGESIELRLDHILGAAEQ